MLLAQGLLFSGSPSGSPWSLACCSNVPFLYQYGTKPGRRQLGSHSITCKGCRRRWSDAPGLGKKDLPQLLLAWRVGGEQEGGFGPNKTVGPGGGSTGNW